MKLWPFNVFSKKTTDWHKALVQVFGLIPQWNRRDYKSFSTEGYNANVWVYRCIQAVASGAASVPWTLYQKRGKNVAEVEVHPLLDLLKNPNEFQGQHEFFESMVAFLLIAGDSYVDMNGPDNGPPMEMWTMRPDRLAIVPDANNFIGYYQYNVISMVVDIPKERVIHLKYFNPLDDFYGLSPIEVAARGIDNDNAANSWNNALLTNGARPTGAMVTDNILSDPQYTKLKGEIDTQYKGSKNAGKPMLLEGGMKWQEMGITPKDMDFINSKKLSRVEICAAFGVPPEIVGDKEHATYSNYQEARKALYEDAILPMLDRIRDKFNATLVKKYGQDLYLDYDKDQIEALQENRDSVYTRANTAYAGGLITKNEAREEMGYGAVDGGDEFFQEPTPVINNPNEPDTMEDDEDDNAEDNLGVDDPKKKDPISRLGEIIEFVGALNVKSFNLQDDEQKTLYWKSMDRRRASYEKRFTKAIASQFKTEQKAVVDAYNANGEDAAIQAVKDGKTAWHKLYAGMYVEVMKDFGNQLFNQLKNQAIELELKAPQIPIDDSFNVFDKAVQDFIANTVALKVVMIEDTTVNKIKDIVSKGMADGLGIVEIGDMLDKLYLDQIIPNRSTVIARTEVIGASNAGNRFAAKQTGLNLDKEWIATRDNRTRSSHSHVDGETKGMDEAFSNGLMFPGDPSGPAAEVIQCRCTEGYSVIK